MNVQVLWGLDAEPTAFNRADTLTLRPIPGRLPPPPWFVTGWSWGKLKLPNFVLAPSRRTDSFQEDASASSGPWTGSRPGPHHGPPFWANSR